MKLKIIIMLAAVLIIGAAEATRYQSATTFVGDITMREAGIEMAGERISDVVWSSYGWYMFDGTTGTELEAFIDANGPGTYYLCNPITISAAEDPITISTDFVRLMGGTIASNIDYGTNQSGTIKFTGTSGTGMIITGLVDFVNLKFKQVNPGLNCMVEARHRQTVEGCSWNTIDAICYKITGVGGIGPTVSYITDNYFAGTNTGTKNTGIGIVLGDDTNTVYSPRIMNCDFCFLHKDIYMVNVSGSKITNCGHLAGVDVGDNTHICVYAKASAANSIADNVFENCIFDYGYGAPAVYVGDGNTSYGWEFVNCYAWSANRGSMSFDKVTDYISVRDCIFHIGRSGIDAAGIEIKYPTTNVIISNSRFVHLSQGFPAIWFSGGGSDVSVTGNNIHFGGSSLPASLIRFDNPTTRVICNNNLVDGEIEFNGVGSDYIICQNNICDEAVDYNSGGTHKVIGDNLVF